MLVDHLSYDLPSKIGPIKIKSLAWADFKGTPPENSPYLAHIYWAVNYEFQNFSRGKPKVKVTVNVRPKSWTKQEQKSLLKHQYGHYLIGCLCGLQFAKKVNYQLFWNQKMNFGLWCRQILGECLKQYCQIEIQYDNQTQHYLNQQKQMKWEKKIRDQFLEFNTFFRNKKQQQLSRKSKKSNQINENNFTNTRGFTNQKLGNLVSKNFTIRKEVYNQNVKTRRKEQKRKQSPLQKIQEKKQSYQSNLSVNSNKKYFKKLQFNQLTSKFKGKSSKASYAMKSHTTEIRPI